MSAPTVSEILEEMGKNCNKSNVIQSQIDEIKVGNKITQRTKIVPQELCNESKQLLLKISLTVKFEYYKTLPLLLTHKIEVQQPNSKLQLSLGRHTLCRWQGRGSFHRAVIGFFLKQIYGYRQNFSSIIKLNYFNIKSIFRTLL